MAGLPLMAVAAPMTRAVATLMAPRPREAAPRLMARPLARGSLPSVQAAAPMAPRPGEAAARLMARPLALGSLAPVRAAAREVALVISRPVVLSAGRAAAMTALVTAGL